MKIITATLLLIALSTSSVVAQKLTVDSKTMQSLKKIGINFSEGKHFKIYLKKGTTEQIEMECNLKLEILKGLEAKFIDDELPEGGADFEYINRNTDTVWECNSNGVFKISKGLFVLSSNGLCDAIDREIIPGGDMFIPGGDMFIPGGDMFIPGGDMFSSDEGDYYYFFKISFGCDEEVEPAIIPLKIK